MAVKRADADSRFFGDSFEARVRTAGAKNHLCGLKHALAVAQCVGTRLS